ncbi:serine/threonine protein kinase [Aurantimonas sp. 22II-16-19i]|uniref:serine/threonine protein kinase n=1 Tax=Aurantimonas sp. 22II-16-19i TaxID=1317114 RepID=UPI0009F7C486|nr:serine/threonine protein kinase [Aurantimonas sp. 22II-16-19i]ORE97224.1 serine/threonine kinase [Aurantimonas sp. 22II-16-19i]
MSDRPSDTVVAGGLAGVTEVHRPAARLEPGTELNDTYVVEELLAAGGMGEVYRGHNLATGETVAIKVILPEFAGDPTFMRLFLREASTLSRLSHDAIVRSQVMSIDKRLNRAYFAMEFVTGRSLKEVAAERPLSPGAVCRLMLRLASGLDVAHRAGIVHRDIAPDNVLLPDDDVERAKLIDFGIAKSARPGDKTILGGSFAGKYNFVSPEQLGRFGGEVTGKSDIYSLALVAVAALRGRPVDMAGSDFERLEKRARVPDLADVPERLGGLLAAMLQPDPAHRPSDMAEICGALLDIGAELPGGAPTGQGWHPRRSAGGVPPGSQGADGATAAAAGGAGPARDGRIRWTERRKPRRWPVVAVAIVAAAGVSVGGIVWARPDFAGGVSETALQIAARIGLGEPRDDPSVDAGPPATGEETASQDDQPPGRLVPALPRGAPAGPTVGEDRQAMLGEPPRLPPLAADPPRYRLPAPADHDPRPDPPTGRRDAQDPAPDRPADSPPYSQPPIALPQPQPADPLLPDGSFEPPQEPVEAMDDTARFVDFIQRFEGGTCFHAVPASVSDTKVRIDAYGKGAGPAQRLLDRFQARFGIEPDIGLRPVTEGQCAAVDFAAERRRSRVDRAAIALEDDVVGRGAPLKARIGNLGDHAFLVLFVDGLGFVQDATPVAKRRGDAASLGLFFRLKRDAPERQLMMVMTAGTPLGEMLPGLPAQAGSVFEDLARKLKQASIPVSVSLQSFRVER